MTTYKYTDSSKSVVHVIDADGVSRSSMLVMALPEGVTVLEPDPPVRDVLGEIAELERETMLPRATREFMLLFTEAQARAEGRDPNGDVRYLRIKEVDDRITELRALLNNTPQ